MRTYSLVFILILKLVSSVNLFSQARLILNNNSFLVIQNDASLVIENPNVNAITESGSGGNIISEGEQNRVIWKIQNNTGTYIIPFCTQSLVNGGNETKIPLEIEINQAGVQTGIGEIAFSTYETLDNNTLWPSDVTHMNNDGGGDNSLFVVDRFWIIEPENYSQKPEGQMTIYFDPAVNETGGTNTININNLMAQRFNSSLNQWGDYSSGVINVTFNRVENIQITDADFFNSWTLVDFDSPLPVEMVEWNAKCNESNISLHWQTASETNNDYFEIEKSNNLLEWSTIGIIDGAGNSSIAINYSFIDNSVGEGTNYYRLKQVDNNGEYSYTSIITISCNDISHDVLIYPNPSTGICHLYYNENFNGAKYTLINSIGQEIYTGKLNDKSTTIDLSNLANGAYYLSILSNNNYYHTKIIKHQ